ncbi:hypothetical protein [Melittangium boletus]|uniref:hypothetical protein n=1 Tax=Melittangium boletus TaxID=83453 RepID=UPI00147447C1|nr:hypothetical protein [Melittangium boletus]
MNNADIASSLGEIGRLYDELYYERAFEQIQRARQLSRKVSDEVVLFLFEGIIFYDMGKLPESSMAFRLALSLRLDAKLPVAQVAPKVENHFESIRQRMREDQVSTSTNGVAAVERCPPSPVMALGKNLRAQQLWRLASMEQMLCIRGVLRASMVRKLSDLQSRMATASSSYDRLRICQDIDKLSSALAVYPSTADWLQAKASVARELSVLEHDDPEVPLLVDPSESVSRVSSKASPERVSRTPSDVSPGLVPTALGKDEPRDVFGCQLAVAARCERLMRSLLFMQEQSLTLDSKFRAVFTRELFLLGRRIRRARTPAELDAASRDIDAWAHESSRH